VISDNARRRDQLRASLPAHIVVVALAPHEFIAVQAIEKTFAVVIDAASATRTMSSQLAVFRDAQPLSPLLWVGRAASIPGVATIVALGAEAMGGLSGRSGLWAVIRVEVVNRILIDTSLRVVKSPRLVTPVAVAAALRNDPPFRSVAGLARYAACDRGTLYNQWPAMLRCSSSTLSLADCLDAVLLLRAASMKRASSGWRHMSRARLGVRPERLHRIARLFGIPLEETCDEGFMALVGAFGAYVRDNLHLVRSAAYPAVAAGSSRSPSTDSGGIPRFAAGVC
jgi:hypothetical protein